MTKRLEEITEPIQELEPLDVGGKQIVIVNNIDPTPPSFIKTISIHGDIDESSAADITAALLYLGELDPEDTSPVKMAISTNGGNALEMFAIYDLMKAVGENIDIETVGLGKVMSAGVLLLSAGKKGSRKIGRNCRIMLHGVLGGFVGSLSNMENEIAEVKWIQNRYIECLAKETKMTKKKIKKMFRKQVDTYLSAKEAINLGIVDKII